MREIKFRGYNGEKWLFGNLDIDYKTKQAAISDDRWWRHPVRFKTVGQFTGLCDSDGREIYEGDVIKLDNDVYTVSWAKYSACWFVDLKNFGPSLFTQYHAGKSIVIGNIHDNPELLEAKDA